MKLATFSAIILFYLSVCTCIYGYKSAEKICPDSWVHYEDSCYRIIKQSVTWSQAEETCRAWNRGHLVSITSLEEQDFVKSLATDEGVRVPIWVGYRKNKYEWVDGSEVFYEDWNSNQPRSYTASTAYTFLSRSGRWKWYDMQHSSNRYLPLCKMTKPATGRCPDASYWTWSNFCYRLQPVMKSFGESKRLCQSQGSHLASIHSEAEMTYLRSQLSRHASNNVWIGFKLRSKPFEFEWTDDCSGNANYTEWTTSSTNSPDVAYVGSVCSKMDLSQRWKWSVIGCHKGGKAYYMCESAKISPQFSDDSCPSQTKNVTDEPVAVVDISTKTSSTESLIEEYESNQLIIFLVFVILAVEIVLVFLLLWIICCFKKRYSENEKIENPRPSVVFRRPSEKETAIQFTKASNQMAYKHMNPENGSESDVKQNTDIDNLVSQNGHTHLKRIGISVLPTVPKCNEYTAYKAQSSYMNEVDIKDEENYSDIDEYEELPLKDSAEEYEQPKK